MRDDRRSPASLGWHGLGPRGLRAIVGLLLCGLLLARLGGCYRSAPSTSEPEKRSPTPGDNGEAASRLPSFPWPPPTPSASIVLSPVLLFSAWPSGPADAASAAAVNRAFGRYSAETLRTQWSAHGPSLMHVDAALSAALMSAGYSESSYFAVPRGFALVTRLEGINLDGTPLPESARWQAKRNAPRNFTFASYIKDLFNAPVGHYRIIVFVVTAEPFVPSKTAVTEAEARGWLTSGSNMLPTSVGSLPFTQDSTCIALIYEFERSDVDTNAALLVPGAISGAVHLQGSGIQRGLKP